MSASRPTSIQSYMPRLDRHQTIVRPLEDVFAFFAAPENLEAITPPFLHFTIAWPPPIVMRAGTRIDYKLRLWGLPVRWRTVIERYTPGRDFVDVQEQGPYRLWRHTHTFRVTPTGTEVHDCVDYELPLGPLGTLAHALLVRRTLVRIFDYRARRVEALLGPGATSLRSHDGIYFEPAS